MRHYGFLAGAARVTRLRVRALLGEIGEPEPQLPELEPFTCGHCDGPLALVGKLERVRKRGPPAWRPAPDEPEKEVSDD